MGYDMIVDAKNRAGFLDNDLYYLGSYEPGVLKYIKENCNKDSVIVDVGANIGVIALYSAKIAKHGKVLAFEPLPELINDLEQNLNINKFSNVEILKYALGSENKMVKIKPNLTERGSSSILDRDDKGFSFGAPVNVEVRQLDEFTKDLKRVDLIKIDVEGYEAEVLKGAKISIKKFLPKIIMEYDPSSELKQELDNIINGLSYNKYILSRGKHYRSKLRPIVDLSEMPNSKLTTLILEPSRIIIR